MSERQERIRGWVQSHPRTMGAFLIALGAFFFYWGIYGPYLDALAHRGSISVGMGGPSLMSPFCFLFGFFLLIFGPKAIKLNSSLDPSPTARNKGLIVIVILACWVVLAAPYSAILGRIETLGYQIKGNPIHYVYTNVSVLHKLAKAADRFIP